MSIKPYKFKRFADDLKKALKNKKFRRLYQMELAKIKKIEKSMKPRNERFPQTDI